MSVSSETTDFLDPPEQAGELGRLGRYRVISLLGRGGMGQVFRAEDTRLKRTVALKVMHSKFAATPNSRKRFIEEARSMAAVHHDNVATIFEVGQQNKTPFIAMELLQGQTLEQQMTAGDHFTFDEVIKIAQQVALGLSAAHERGIVHRDIKPANLWMQKPQGRTKILDFGLALAGTGVDELSATGSVVGTLGYLAPEQASDEPVDERTDLYALGVVMYQMCCGGLPLLANNVSRQLVAILASEPIPLADRNPQIPGPLADLIGELIQKDPSDRIPTAIKLHDRLGELAGEIEQSQKRHLEIVVDSDASAVAKGALKNQAVTADRPRFSSRLQGKHAFRDRSKSNTEHEVNGDKEDAFETTEPETGFRFRTWLPIVTSALLLVGLATYWGRQPKKVAFQVSDATPDRQPGSNSVVSDAYAHLSGPPNPHTAAKSISIESLKALAIEVVPDQVTKVRAGSFVSQKLVFANNAETPLSDPSVVFRDKPKVAQVAVSLQRAGKTLPNAPAFPQSFSAARLPRAGQTVPITFTFPTKGVKRGTYKLIFELQTPDGKTASTATMPLVITKFSQKGD